MCSKCTLTTRITYRNPTSARGATWAKPTVGLPKTNPIVSAIPQNTREAAFCQLLPQLDCSGLVDIGFMEVCAVHSQVIFATKATTKTSLKMLIFALFLFVFFKLEEIYVRGGTCKWENENNMHCRTRKNEVQCVCRCSIKIWAHPNIFFDDVGQSPVWQRMFGGAIVMQFVLYSGGWDCT